MTHKYTSAPVHAPSHPPTHQPVSESYSPGSGKREGSPAVPNQNMGREQHAEPHWREWGDSSEKEHNYFRGPEWADRLEREAYGKPLPAAYRHLLGPAPALSPGDTDGARSYLSRIEQAIEQGGWTRSEARRLRKLKGKWQERASGVSARFKEVGNRRGGLTPFETANVKARTKMDEIKIEMMKELINKGD